MEAANDNSMTEKTPKPPFVVGGKDVEKLEKNILGDACDYYLELIKKPVFQREGAQQFALQAEAMTNNALLDYLKEFSANLKQQKRDENPALTWAIMTEVANRGKKGGFLGPVGE